jgi:hypothetical protein
MYLFYEFSQLIVEKLDLDNVWINAIISSSLCVAIALGVDRAIDKPLRRARRRFR